MTQNDTGPAGPRTRREKKNPQATQVCMDTCDPTTYGNLS